MQRCTLAFAILAASAAPLCAQTGVITCGGTVVGFIDDFETLEPLPAPLHNQTTIIDDNWVNTWLALPSIPDRAAISNNTLQPIGGNASQTLRGRVTNVSAGNIPFIGARVEFPDVMTPASDGLVRYETEVFVQSLLSGWTWDVGEAPLARVGWGGFDIGNGQFVDTFRVATNAGYVEARYVGSAPAGASVGDVVPTPVNEWFRLSIEHDLDRDMRVYINYLDGQGRFLIHSGTLMTNLTGTDAWRFMAYLESLAVTVHFENLTVRNLRPGCGDLDGDGNVNFADLNQLLGAFNTTPGLCPGADLNLDERIDFADLNVMLGRFNQPCE